MNFIKKLDLYPVSIPIYHKNQKEFGSFFGGTITLIINILALLYTIFVLYQWRTFSILPKSQTKTNTLQGGSIKIIEQFISVGILNALPDNIIDPFVNESNIITIFILKVNGSEIEFYPVFSQSNEFIRKMVYVSDLEIHMNKANPESIKSANYISEVFYAITWMKCNQTMLQGKGTCAPQEQIDSFFKNLPPLLDINVKLKQFNPSSRKFEKIFKTSYIAINNVTRFYSQLMLMSSKIIIDDGLIMESKIEESIVSNYELLAQTVPEEYFLSNFNYDVLGMFILRMDNLQTEQLIVYPKLGEILAQISSITSLLFLLQHVVRYYNSIQLEKSLIEDIIMHFYPNLSSYKIKYKYFWKIEQISKEGKLYNVSDFIQFQKKLQLSIKQYFNLEYIAKKQIELSNYTNINKNQDIFFLDQIPLNLESLQVNQYEEYDQMQVVPLDLLKNKAKTKLSILDCGGEDSKKEEDNFGQK